MIKIKTKPMQVEQPQSGNGYRNVDYQLRCGTVQTLPPFKRSENINMGYAYLKDRNAALMCRKHHIKP